MEWAKDGLLHRRVASQALACRLARRIGRGQSWLGAHSLGPLSSVWVGSISRLEFWSMEVPTRVRPILEPCLKPYTIWYFTTKRKRTTFVVRCVTGVCGGIFSLKVLVPAVHFMSHCYWGYHTHEMRLGFARSISTTNDWCSSPHFIRTPPYCVLSAIPFFAHPNPKSITVHRPSRADSGA